ncbi:bark storage protein A-like isoform X1 [Pyrus communis]|uniref:bark storage protein A-like isoform X1 n=1 Tax=Pyrus communis TaxID=23211 RepID=UPI0035C100B9
MRTLSVASILLYALLMLSPLQLNVALSTETQMLIEEANMSGPYLGLVIPNSYEMDPLLQSPNFTSSNLFIDFSGRRFRFGTIANKPVILVMTGLSMINAAITTQLLLSQFDIEGVVHYGVAGHANPSLNLADVVIPQYWSHSALWSWQRYGNGPEDELPLEKDGDYTREIGYLNVANYTTNVTDGSTYDNLLNNIWFQPEEVFPIDGTPEERQHSFWVAVDPLYYEISQKLEDLQLERCLNSTTCLPHIPKVSRVERGTSASIFLSNAAYRSFLFDKFNISPLDMESASVALVCLQQRVPFIVIRALSSSSSGSGSSDPNEAAKFISLASKNSVMAVVEFIRQLSLHQQLITH